MNIYKIQSSTQKLLVIDHLSVLLCFLTFLTYASCLCFPAQEHHRVICEALTNSLSNREMVLQGGWRRAEQRYVLQSCYVVLHVRYAEPLLWKTARGQKTKRRPVRSGRTETTSGTKKPQNCYLWPLNPDPLPSIRATMTCSNPASAESHSSLNSSVTVWVPGELSLSGRLFYSH